MTKFSEWVSKVKPFWRPKNLNTRTVFVQPQFKLELHESWADSPYFYLSLEDDVEEEVDALYSLIHPYMSIRMERELIKKLQASVDEWEEKYGRKE